MRTVIFYTSDNVGIKYQCLGNGWYRECSEYGREVYLTGNFLYSSESKSNIVEMFIRAEYL